MHLSQIFSNEPYDTIQKYLNIQLSEKTPLIDFEKQKIGVESIHRFYAVAEKASEQLEILKKTINYLYSEHSLFVFDFEEIKVTPHHTSSSTDSIHQKKKKSEKKNYRSLSFSAELFENKNPKSVPNYLLISKMELILTIARNAIVTLSNGQLLLERFHRNALANALDCHANYSIKPLCQIKKLGRLSSMNRSHSSIEEVSEKQELIKNLSTEIFNELFSYWLKGGSGSKIQKTLGLTNNKEEKNLNNELYFLEKLLARKLKKEINFIKESNLLNPQSMKELIEESIIRELSTQSIETLVIDIVRQFDYIIILEEEKQLFPLSNKNLQNPSSFNSNLQNLKNMIGILFSLIDDGLSKDFILAEIEFQKNKVKNNQEGFLELCSLFFNGLEEDTRKEKSTKEKAAQPTTYQKLRLLLLTLTQKTYSLATIMIFQILKELSMTTVPGSDSRFIEYTFKKKDVQKSVELRSGFKTSSEKHPHFELLIENLMKADLNNLSCWSSHLSIQVKITNESKKAEVEEDVIKPLKHFGFPIKILP